MENMDQNTTGTRKKLLVPLVVLLLCAVSLAGAAYAYSSSVTVNNNTVSGEEFVLEMYNHQGDVISAPIPVDAIRITPDTTIGDANKVIVKAETNTAGDANIYTGTLKLYDTSVTNDEAERVLTYSATIANDKDGIINASDLTAAGATGTGSIGYTVVVELYADAGHTSAITSGAATNLAFNGESYVTLYYVVTVEATAASATGITFNNTAPKADADAVKTLFNAENKFILEFSASEA